MKKLLLSLTLLTGMASFAQTDAPAGRSFPALAPAQAGAHGIIYEQPEGTSRLYIRSGGATYAPIYFLDDPQDGIMAEVVFSEDGTKAWFKNIISHAATGTWVEGTVKDNVITVPLGQTVYWFDGGYGLKLARVKVNGNIQDATTTIRGDITFAIEGDDLVLQGTSGDSETTVYDGIGLVYTDAYAGEWSYYLDYETVLHFKDVHATTPPQDLETETYSMEYMNTSGLQTGNIVSVGFSGRDVYVLGISRDNLPDAWIQGTVSGNQLTFPTQYMGHTSSFMLYLFGGMASFEYDESGYGDWKYILEREAVFDFDQRTRSFSTEGMLATNSDADHVDRIEAYLAPAFQPFTEQAATPANPSIRYYQNMGTFSILMLDIPLKDTEGRFIDPEKVAYQLYVDDDEPYTLYPDEYKYLPAATDEVPYFFPAEMVEAYSRSYIYERGYAIYLFQTGFDRIGVQTIYRGGGEERRSEIGYYDLTGDGIQAPDVTRKSVNNNSFDLTGRPVDNHHRGLTITRRADGSIVKHLNR